MFLFIEHPFRIALYKVNVLLDVLRYTKEFLGSFQIQDQFYDENDHKMTLKEILDIISNHYDSIEKLKLFKNQDENAPVKIYFGNKTKDKILIYILESQN